jgi:hypothetical protein
MKKIAIIVALIVFIVSCSHKTTPAASIVIPKADSPEAIAGKEVFTAKCGKCHELKDPADYTPKKWISIVNDMAPKAKLDATEKKNVLAYVQANAKKD